MTIYADQLKELKLVKLLKSSAGRDDISQSDVDQLHANVLKAADTAGRLLEAIPVTFKQYTEHNLGHSANLIRLMGKFIPEKTQEELNALEIAVLIFSALLHDLGMFVTDAERTDFLKSKEFVPFLNAAPEKERAIAEARAAGKHVTARVIEDAVIADYFRRVHPERVRQHIEQHEELRSALRFREYSLVDAVSRICESHGWGVYESTDPRFPKKTIKELKPRQRIYDVRFNEQYIAAALRLADIMDFDRSRTPLALLKTIDFTEARSQAEWQKHLQIKGWEVTDRDVAFQAECTRPEHYVAVMEFIEWIDAELRDCRRLLVRDAPKDIAERYLFQLPPAVDRIHVEMEDKSFIAGAFRFELDYERIMKLLMDRSLYPDPSLFLRELLQNSLDACRVRMAMAKYENAEDRYKPQIAVWDRTKDGNRTIVFQDNGIGMSRSIIENYFMRVGRSYYRSNEFHAERKRLLERDVELEATSQFGIGFLSCFMVADKIEIETYRRGYQQLYVLIEGATKYFTMKIVDPPAQPEFLTQGESIETDGPPAFPGTRVTLHLRPDAKVDVRQTLETFAVNVEVPIAIVKEGEERVEVPAYRWRGDPMQFVGRLVGEESAEAWSRILVPVDVPLHDYDFCDGLDGRAWFWMLRQPNGEPGVRLGWLRLAEGIQVTGIPAAASELAYEDELRLEAEDSLPASLPVTADFRARWNASDIGFREEVLRHVQVVRSAPYWGKNPLALRALVVGDDSWLTIKADYSSRGPSATTPGALALHGILVPAAITRWDPMRGTAASPTVVNFLCGFAIDMRKRVPTPAANRLFIAPHDGAAVAIAIIRAFVTTALDLADEHRDDADWIQWCRIFFRRLSYADWSYHAVRPEYTRIQSLFRFEVQGADEDEVIGMSRDELRATFGRFVRYDYRFPSSGINEILFSKYARRLTADGYIEYDLDTEADLPPID